MVEKYQDQQIFIHKFVNNIIENICETEYSPVGVQQVSSLGPHFFIVHNKYIIFEKLF